MTGTEISHLDKIADVYEKQAWTFRRSADALIDIANSYRRRAQEERENAD